MTVEVVYEGMAVLRPARLGLFLTDADRDIDFYVTDSLAAALEAKGVATTSSVPGRLRLRVEFDPVRSVA